MAEIFVTANTVEGIAWTDILFRLANCRANDQDLQGSVCWLLQSTQVF
jgi:hypothetical protein